ncbi:MAG: NAD(P)/FAD-dependent oxidoreductase [Gammaproteobacteria bacterium]
MKIAIIGSGIAGNVAAYRLRDEHDITVFEANDYVGGHVNTIDVDDDGTPLAVDTGFIVFNDWTYPNFIELLENLGVASKPTSMSFSVQCERSGLEYNGTTLNTLFAQRRNLFRPSFYRMIRDILRFNREAPLAFPSDDHTGLLGDYLDENDYSSEFVSRYLLPMCAAIWSADPSAIKQAPARFIVRFLENHGLLNVNDRPIWRVVEGGSRAYVDKLIAGHRNRIRLSSPVQWIKRDQGGVDIKVRGHATERFDYVFIASHSDQALRMLADPTPIEKEVLGAIRYQPNEAVLHTDASLLPKRRLAWAAWNYHIAEQRSGPASVTYDMNILQGLESARTYCVTLNDTARIDPDKIIRHITYDHPLFTREGVVAQSRHAEINGDKRTFYCGAYWRNGFHEDGVVSALAAIEHFEEYLRNAELYFRRTA